MSRRFATTTPEALPATAPCSSSVSSRRCPAPRTLRGQGASAPSPPSPPLASNGRSGRCAPALADAALREIIVGDYRTVYRLRKAAAEILTVFHGARAFPVGPRRDPTGDAR